MIQSINLFGFEMSTYWLMLLAGMVGMLILLLLRRKRFTLSVFKCILFTLLLTVSGVLGAKILYILENFKSTIENGISLGGMSFFGSVFLIPIMMPLVGKLFKLKLGETLDICGPCVALMIAFMRLGCFMQGCCGGWVANFGNVQFVWPTQLMEFVGDIAILIWLLHFERLNQMRNKLYPLFMISYSVLRFFIEFLRYKADLWLGLGHGQWFAMLAIIVGLIWIYVCKNYSRFER